MKHLILATALCAALGVPAQAEKNLQAENCASLAELAEALMMARQEGVALAVALQIAASDPAIREVVESMARMAWSENRWNSPDTQRRAVSDFRDRMHLLCLGA